MLPPELLFLVCDHLDRVDILSLAHAGSENKAILAVWLRLFVGCPFYMVRYSPYNSLMTFAANFQPPKKHLKFKHSKLPALLNTLLPDDFQCLQGYLDRKEHEWFYCNEGLGRTYGGILNLRADEKTVLLPSSVTLKPHGEVLKFESNSHVAVQIVRDQIMVVIKYADNSRVQECTLDKADVEAFYKILVFVSRVRSENTDDMYYILPDSNGLYQMNWKPLMLYDGVLYKVSVGSGDKLQVATRGYPVKGEGIADLQYDIFQDQRHPRYGMVYTEMEGLLDYVVDLETKEVFRVLRVLEEGHISIAGISNGKLGVWKYSWEFLWSLIPDVGDAGSDEELTELHDLVLRLKADSKEFFDFNKKRGPYRSRRDSW
ncbi:hypothetical protein CJU89_5878 [Yarrowia sp. B02]|nr:hypothetical protein CJU89_5878 [Yarrowia sp. B02]